MYRDVRGGDRVDEAGERGLEVLMEDERRLLGADFGDHREVRTGRECTVCRTPCLRWEQDGEGWRPLGTRLDL